MRLRGIVLPEPAPQSKHEFLQVNSMRMRELLLAQQMVRIQTLLLMPRTKRDRREVRGLLPQSLGPYQTVLKRAIREGLKKAG